MSAAGVFPRSDFSTNDGPYVVGAAIDPSNSFAGTNARLLTITVENGSPKVHVEQVQRPDKNDETPIASKYKWDIKESRPYSPFFVFIHCDTGYGLKAPNGILIADTSRKFEAAQPFRVHKGIFDSRAHDSQQLDQYTLTHQDHSVQRGLVVSHDNFDEPQMRLIQDGSTFKDYQRRAPHHGFWYIRSVGPTQMSLLEEAKKLREETKRLLAESDKFRKDLNAAVNSADAAKKEKEDAVKREMEAKEKSTEAEKELGRLKTQVEEAQSARKQQEEACAVDKANLKQNLDDATAREKENLKRAQKLETDLTEAKSDLDEAQASVKQHKENANREIASLNGRLADVTRERDRLRSENSALQRDHDKQKGDADEAKEKLRNLRAELTKAQSDAEAAQMKNTEQQQAYETEKGKLNQKLENAVADRNRLRNENSHIEETLGAAQKAKDKAEQDRDHAFEERDKLRENLDKATTTESQQRAESKAEREELEKKLEDAQRSEKRKDKQIQELRHDLSDREADEKAAREAQKVAEAARDAAVDKAKNEERDQASAKHQNAQAIEALTADKEDLSKKLTRCRNDGDAKGKELDALRRERPELVRKAEQAEQEAQKAQEQLAKGKAARKEAENNLIDERHRNEELQRTNSSKDDRIRELEKQLEKERAANAGNAGRTPGASPAGDGNKPSRATTYPGGKDELARRKPDAEVTKPENTASSSVTDGAQRSPENMNGTTATSHPSHEHANADKNSDASSADPAPSQDKGSDSPEHLQALDQEIRDQKKQIETLQQQIRDLQNHTAADNDGASSKDPNNPRLPNSTGTNLDSSATDQLSRRPEAAGAQNQQPSASAANDNSGQDGSDEAPLPQAKPEGNAKGREKPSQQGSGGATKLPTVSNAGSSATPARTGPLVDAEPQPNQPHSSGASAPSGSQQTLQKPDTNANHQNPDASQPAIPNQQPSGASTQAPSKQSPSPDYEQLKHDMEQMMNQKLQEWEAQQAQKEHQSGPIPTNQAVNPSGGRTNGSMTNGTPSQSADEVDRQTQAILDSIANGGGSTNPCGSATKSCTQCGRPYV